MSVFSNAYSKQGVIVDALQDRLLDWVDKGRPADEIRNLSVALGIAFDKLTMQRTEAS